MLFNAPVLTNVHNELCTNNLQYSNDLISRNLTYYLDVPVSYVIKLITLIMFHENKNNRENIRCL